MNKKSEQKLLKVLNIILTILTLTLAIMLITFIVSLFIPKQHLNSVEYVPEPTPVSEPIVTEIVYEPEPVATGAMEITLPLANEFNEYYYCGDLTYLNQRENDNVNYADCSSGVAKIDDTYAITIPNYLSDITYRGQVFTLAIQDNVTGEFVNVQATLIDYNESDSININTAEETYFGAYDYSVSIVGGLYE